MGGCISRQGGCAPVKPRLRRGRGNMRRLGSRKNRVLGYNKVSKDVSENSEQLDLDSPVAGNDAWLEPNPLYESDSGSEDEYHSVPDLLSNESEDSSSSELLFQKDDMIDDDNNTDTLYFYSNLTTAPNDLQSKYMTHSSATVFSKDVAHKSETSGKAKNKFFAEDMSSTSEKNETLNCLPYLNIVYSEKRKSGNSSPSAKTRVAPDPYMSLEVQSNTLLFPSIMIRKKPLAGTQFPLCPRGKEMFDSWSPIEPSTFRVRGMNYLRDKKKENASSKVAYHPVGVDVYLSHRKINHIARLVELPAISSLSTLPGMLVVNVQIPLYAPSIFQNENDGEGMNVVMYFKLSEKFEKELPLHFQESIKRLIDDEIEKVKGFPMDTTVPFRERLKILGRVTNVDDLQLSVPQRKLMHAYNEKPILSRPQHEFYLGENYFEIDLDMHRFNYISRKGFDVFQDKLKICILDIGLTIQGNKAEELPENILCCLRINGIDHTNYHHLEPSEEIL